MVFTAASVGEYSKAQDLTKILNTAKQAGEMLQEIKLNIKPGIKESEATAMAFKVYKDYGVTRSWHKPYIRFGHNTLLTYNDTAKEDLVLREEDIAFIDIGPIFDDMEGDIGETLVFGDNAAFNGLKSASEELFRVGKEFYSQANPTGEQMYKFLCDQAQDLGYEFNLHTCGHLIGLFSHEGCGNKGGMRFHQERMQPGVWILEVQIRHKELPYGAFYENVLI